MEEKTEKLSTENLLALYETYAQDNRTYNNVVWQFPTAFITINILFLNFLWDKPQVLLVVTLLNFVLIQALFKLAYNQGVIIRTLKAYEGEMVTRFEDGSKLIPNFNYDRKRLIKIPSKFLISYSLLILNVVYFAILIVQVFFAK